MSRVPNVDVIVYIPRAPPTRDSAAPHRLLPFRIWKLGHYARFRLQAAKCDNSLPCITPCLIYAQHKEDMHVDINDSLASFTASWGGDMLIYKAPCITAYSLEGSASDDARTSAADDAERNSQKRRKLVSGKAGTIRRIHLSTVGKDRSDGSAVKRQSGGARKKNVCAIFSRYAFPGGPIMSKIRQALGSFQLFRQANNFYIQLMYS